MKGIKSILGMGAALTIMVWKYALPTLADVLFR